MPTAEGLLNKQLKSENQLSTINARIEKKLMT